MKKSVIEKREISLTMDEVQEAIAFWLKSKHREPVEKKHVQLKFHGNSEPYAEISIEVKKETKKKEIKHEEAKVNDPKPY